MWHKPCRTFRPWCLCIKTRCLYHYLMTGTLSLVKLLLGDCQWTPLIISQHWSRSLPEPILTQIYVAIWPQWVNLNSHCCLDMDELSVKGMLSCHLRVSIFKDCGFCYTSGKHPNLPPPQFNPLSIGEDSQPMADWINRLYKAFLVVTPGTPLSAVGSGGPSAGLTAGLGSVRVILTRLTGFHDW